MIETMEQSKDNVLGFRAVGEVTKEDYATLGPAVSAAIKQYGTIRVLIDLTDFKREKAEAWGSDLGFGHEYHDKIERMALVGDQSWGKHVAKIAQPFYAESVEWFDTDADAWTWVEG